MLAFVAPWGAPLLRISPISALAAKIVLRNKTILAKSHAFSAGPEKIPGARRTNREDDFAMYLKVHAHGESRGGTPDRSA